MTRRKKKILTLLLLLLLLFWLVKNNNMFVQLPIDVRVCIWQMVFITSCLLNLSHDPVSYYYNDSRPHTYRIVFRFMLNRNSDLILNRVHHRMYIHTRVIHELVTFKIVDICLNEMYIWNEKKKKKMRRLSHSTFKNWINGAELSDYSPTDLLSILQGYRRKSVPTEFWFFRRTFWEKKKRLPSAPRGEYTIFQSWPRFLYSVCKSLSLNPLLMTSNQIFHRIKLFGFNYEIT